jgi:hypothetical protein
MTPGGCTKASPDAYGDKPDAPPTDKQITLASYVAGPLPEAYLEFVAVGDALPAMPLFLDPETYMTVPLEPTCETAYHGMPEISREVLEGPAPPPLCESPPNSRTSGSLPRSASPSALPSAIHSAGPAPAPNGARDATSCPNANPPPARPGSRDSLCMISAAGGFAGAALT